MFNVLLEGKMENWIPDAVTILALAGLWWKVSSDIAKLSEKMGNMATKEDVREIRQMLFSHISDGHKHSN